MKSLGWAHLDIKPENVLLNSNFEVKLIDFEYACFCKENSCASEKICGTMNYFSPEIKEKKLPYDPFKSDIFSLGITFMNLLGLCDLFPIAKHCFAREENYSNMKENKFQKIWKKMDEISLTKYFSCEFKELIELMIRNDPEKRISIEEVRENEWFCQDLFTNEQMINLFASL
jgi:serine/threonine protein kinase